MNILLITLGLLPGFAWLIFYLQEDLHPEPKRLIVLTFLIGAVSVFAAFFLEEIFNNLAFRSGIQRYAPLSLLGLGLIEELTKFGAVYLFIHKKREFDEPVDAMIYMTIAALGFATVENIAALFSSQTAAPLAIINNIFNIAAFRSINTTLLHSLSSAIVGYYWAVSIREFGASKFLVGGLILAAFLHALFNFLILYYGVLIYPVVLVIIMGFFVLADFEKLRKRTI